MYRPMLASACGFRHVVRAIAPALLTGLLRGAWTGVVDFERGLFIIIYAPPRAHVPRVFPSSSKYNPIIHTSSIVHPPLPCYLPAGRVPGRVARAPGSAHSD